MKERISTIEDELLVLAIQDGNDSAMNELITRWQKRLWLHACRVTGDSQASLDIVQESWLAIIKGIAKLKEPSAYKSWMYRITTYKAIDWINNKNKTPLSLDSQEIDIIQKEKQDHSDIYALLDQLDIKKRIVIILFYFEDQGINEIAKTLKIPVGTVKSRLNIARNELRQIIGSHS